MKADHTAFKSTRRIKQCDLNKLKDHFVKHFNGTLRIQFEPLELQEAPSFIKQIQEINCADMRTCPPDLKELRNTIKKLKNGKSANDIPAAYVKSAMQCRKFQDEIVKLYQTI